MGDELAAANVNRSYSLAATSIIYHWNGTRRSNG
jgi:hypothetical protein